MKPKQAIWLSALLALLAPLAARGDGPLAEPAPNAAATTAAVSSSGASSDTQPIDVALATDRHVVFFRFFVKKGGGDFVNRWQTFLEKRFRAADADGDGALSAEELKTLGPLITPLKPNRNQNQVFFEDDGNGSPAQTLVSDPPADPSSDRRLAAGTTCDQFLEFLRAGMNTPVRVEARVQDSAGSAPLFARLDANHDEKLSAEECAKGFAVLESMDYYNTEVFNRNQLTGVADNPRRRVVNNGNGQPRQNPSKTQLAVKLLSQAGAGSSVAGAERIRAHFAALAKDEPTPIPRVALVYDEATFAPFDADGDGSLDSDELAQMLRRPHPHLELTTNLEGPQPMLSAKATHLDPAGAHLDDLAGQSTLVLGDERIEMANGQNNGFGAENQIRNIESRFKQADEDNNEYLDNREAQRYGMPGLMALDTDGDGKLYMREISAYINAEAEMAAHRMIIVIVDYGHGLFEAIDTDHDDLLSRRELNQLSKRIAEWDRDGDGQLSMEEVPHLYAMQVSQEQVRLPRNNGIFGNNFAVGGRARGVRANNRNRAMPSWFMQMDRNSDGDLSVQEFLGTTAQFRKFDVDGDQLIDANEATASITPPAEPKAETAAVATAAAPDGPPPSGDAAEDAPPE